MPRRTSKPAALRANLAALSAWAPELAETFVALACDIALVIDDDGVVRKLAQPTENPLVAADDWLGRAWADIASEDSRAKVEQMLADVAAIGIARRREINHPQAQEPLALAYTAIRLGPQGPTLAVGHDLRAQAAMQQRFLAAQQALEQSYWQSRQHEPTHPAVAANAPMSASERASDGLASAHAVTVGEQGASDPLQPLLRALDGLRDRIGRDALPGLLRDAKRLIEEHFLQSALERSGSKASVARSLGRSRGGFARRQGRKNGKPAKPGKAGAA
jgi:hypothetical protein